MRPVHILQPFKLIEVGDRNSKLRLNLVKTGKEVFRRSVDQVPDRQPILHRMPLQSIMTVAFGQVAGFKKIKELEKGKARRRDFFSPQGLRDEMVGRPISMQMAETADGALERVPIGRPHF